MAMEIISPHCTL